MKGEENLYFIAVLPPACIRSEITEIKYFFWERFQSKAALKSPPHITIHMPFRLQPGKEGRVEEVLRNTAAKCRPFVVETKNYGAFPPRVIFLDVKASDGLSGLHQEVGRSMRRELNIFNAEYKDRPFHPHITVAFRDLKKPAFREAWEEYQEKSVDYRFWVDHLTLLKNLNGKWVIFREYPLINYL